MNNLLTLVLQFARSRPIHYITPELPEAYFVMALGVNGREVLTTIQENKDLFIQFMEFLLFILPIR